MKLLVLGDIHGRWKKVERIVEHELKEPGTIAATGDLCSYHFDFLRDHQFVFIWGNHDSKRFLQEKLKGQKPEDKTYVLTPGDIYTLQDGTTIAGLSGSYSQHFFSQQERPFRFYSKEDVEKMKSLSGADILLLHEAPRGIGVVKKAEDVGRQEITDIIQMVKPRIAFFGHHHIYLEEQLGETKVIGLQRPQHSYVILDTKDFSTERFVSKLQNNRWTYGWEL